MQKLKVVQSTLFTVVDSLKSPIEEYVDIVSKENFNVINTTDFFSSKLLLLSIIL